MSRKRWLMTSKTGGVERDMTTGESRGGVWAHPFFFTGRSFALTQWDRGPVVFSLEKSSAVEKDKETVALVL